MLVVPRRELKWSAALVAVVAVAGLVVAAPAPPPPLSGDAPVRIDSTYGSGGFGTWHVDAFGLPAFRYAIDETADARAQQPELAGGTEAQHQVGNDHIVAAAFNHGYTQLWSQDRLAQWANRYEPQTPPLRRRLRVPARRRRRAEHALRSTARRAPTSSATSASATARKRVRADGLDVEQVVYAPFGDDPLLLDDVTITNSARHDAPCRGSSTGT